MFENIMKLFKKTNKREALNASSKEAAKERLHLVLMQDRANVSADFLDLMRQEIIEVIKKYIDIDESAMDVRLTNQANEDGTQGAPALYANIPILNIKEETRSLNKEKDEKKQAKEQKKENNDKENTNKENTNKNYDKKNAEKDIEINNTNTDNSKNVKEENDKDEKQKKAENTESAQSEEKINKK